DCALIMNPKVWEASGHVGGFADPMADCRACKARFRADQVWVVLYYNAVRSVTLENVNDALQIVHNLEKHRGDVLSQPLSQADRTSKPQELLHQFQSALEKMKPDTVKSAVAGSQEEAFTAAEPTKREQKALAHLKRLCARPLSLYSPKFFGPIPCPNCGAPQL